MTSVCKVIIVGDLEPLASVSGAAMKNAQGAVTPRAQEDHSKADPQADKRIVQQRQPSEKAFATVAAKFALRGHTLSEKVHHGTGLRLWEVSRWGQTRVFSHWFDVASFLTQIGD